jgi:tetratricopeptide (TPR) repeat protein
MAVEFLQLKEQANNLRKQKQFEQALSIYKRILEEYPGEFGGWEQVGYAACLRHVGHSLEALNVLRELYPKLKDAEPSDERLFSWCRNEYGRCVYDTEIKILNQESQIDEPRLFKAATAIVQLTAQEEYSPYELTIFRVVDYLQNKQSPNYGQILFWLDKLAVDLLSTQSRPGNPDDPHNQSYPSSKEKWYAARTKALLEMERYTDCIELCTIAFSEFQKFHYDYDVWLKWYRAKSFLAMKQPADALNDLREVQKFKRDFFVDHEIARAYFMLGDLENAISIAAKAALIKGSLEFKWELFLLMGEILERKGELDIANSHIQLAAKIREEQGWNKVPGRLQQILQRLEVNMLESPNAKICRQNLLSYWNSLKPVARTDFSGTVLMIHGNGKSGMIRNADGRQHFFGVKSFSGLFDDLKTGLQVAFNVMPTVNKKTGQDEFHAVDIVELKP